MSTIKLRDDNTSSASARYDNNNVQVLSDGAVTFTPTVVGRSTATFSIRFQDSSLSKANSARVDIVTRRDDFVGLQKTRVGVRIIFADKQ